MDSQGKGKAPMHKDSVLSDGLSFARELRKLHRQSRTRIKRLRPKRIPRSSLSAANRRKVLEKTAQRCHICGGSLDDDKWHADHVLAHASGGAQSLENYLPTHSTCNSYRRCFSDVEFQWVLKLGVWLRGEIARETVIGREASHKFCRHHRRLEGRRIRS
jgi:5-methylcytosine-specific restriction endonuclease McrA